MFQGGRIAVSILDEATEFLNRPNPSSLTIVLGSNHPLKEITTRNLPGGKGLTEAKADITAVCEPPRLTTYGTLRPVTGIAATKASSF